MNATRILIVEDEIIVAEHLRQELQNARYEVCGIATCSSEALELAQSCRPDLILMDIRINGDKDGIETAGLIHQSYDIPVIYLTAYTDDQTLKRAKETEPFGYLLKPYCLAELRSSIEMSLYKHRIDRQLKEREQWLHTVLHSIDDAVIATDGEFRVLFMNPKAEALTGFTQAQALEKPLKSLLELHDENQDEANIAGAILQTPISRRSESIHLYLSVPGRGPIPVMISLTPLTGAEGGPRGAVLVIKDVTERQNLEEKLHQHQETLAHVNRVNTIEQMTAALAHEINQPLTAITTLTDGCLQMFKVTPPALEDIRSAMEDVSCQAKRAGEILRHIRHFVRKHDNKPHKFDLNVLIRRVILLAKPEFNLQQAALSLQLTAVPLYVDADELQIEQVLLNMIRNGLEAMLDSGPEERILTVSSALDKGFCRVSVSDQGSGIDPQILPNLFHSFCSTKNNGLGIGLSLSKSIVTNFGGQIWAKNNPQKGATFHFTLPYCRQSIQTMEAEPASGKLETYRV